MLKYTLCLVKQGTRILLLNREKPTWMGCWNGVGGKLEKDEQPRASMLREIAEETQIEVAELQFKGLITWTTVEGAGFGGLYLYLAEIAEDYIYETPIKTAEGILDWKEITWIQHPENLGVSSNLTRSLEKLLNENSCYNHHGIFSGDRLVDQITTPVDSVLESDENLRLAYLNHYIESYISNLSVIKST